MGPYQVGTRRWQPSAWLLLLPGTHAWHPNAAPPPALHPSSHARPCCSNVEGCDCCLAHTTSVGACFQKSRSCGPDYCNCEDQDPECVTAASSLQQLLDSWSEELQCPCGQAYLQRAAESPEADLATSQLSLECDSVVEIDAQMCSPGKVPAVTITALHQVGGWSGGRAGGWVGGQAGWLWGEPWASGDGQAGRRAGLLSSGLA